MPTMRLTDSQKDAVEVRARNIIVSAGAGSGKTTVLTKRILDRIIAGDSILDFLVVTYMHSAAADMKRKLQKALAEAYAADPSNEHLYREMTLIPEADICTISSFCLSLVRENFARLGISPNPRTIDETEQNLLLTGVADALLDDLYARGDDKTKRFIDNFSKPNSDSDLIDTMLSCYKKLIVVIDWDGMLQDCADSLRADAEITLEKGFFASGTGAGLRDSVIKNYKELYSDVNGFYVLLTRYAKNDKPVKVAGELLDKIESVVSALNKGYTSYIEEANAQLAHFNNFPAANNITEDMKEYLHKSYNGYKDKFKEDVGKFRYGSERKIAESFIETADIIESAKEFLLMLDERYQAEKKASGLIDFSDYERYALSLLETRDENGVPVPSELCLRKSEAIKEVLIDEYQDANPMQDRIFTLLASKGSRFMVGDVKQSIYAFRNAFPDIFLSYKDAYPDVSEKAADARVLLRENFRCSQCVIDYVNHIFDTATKGTDYRREYEGEWLVHASDKPEIRRPVVVAYAPYSGVKGSASEARINEADYVAREIKRLVNEGSNNDGSPVRYSDIAVMMSATKGHSIEYKKAFAKYGIPYKSEDKTDFLKNPVVSLAISALNAVDDPTDEIPLCALMRSPVFDFTSDELYRIRISNKEVSFWDAVTYYARPARKKISKTAFRKDKTRHGGVSLCAKCRAFVRKLAEWRHAAEGVPCSAFIKSFFVSSGLLRIAAAESQKKSLMLLYEYSEKFKASSYNGISGFLDQIKQLGSGNREISDVASAGDPDSVTISTIHKAKGLEYKVCFLINADKEFNFSDVSNDLLLLQRKGMYFVIKNRKKLTKYKPACYCYAQEIMKENMRGEELRKLYVALTRAMERLYVTGIWKGDPREDPPSVMKDKSFFDYVIFDATREEKSFFDLQIILPSDGTQGYIPDRRRQSIIPGRELIDVINYEYPFKKASETAKKISVSELREGLLEDDEYDRSLIEVPASRVSYKPSFAAGYASTFADIGTANHVFMQFCDFKNVEKSGVEAEACRLRDTKMITEEQYGMLDKAALERFFKSALYAEMRVSPVLHREMRFSVKEDVFKNGEPVLIQGVIDCFFRNADGSYTVVDYKTDRVKSGKELADRHRVQLECYCRAVERMTGEKVSRALLYSFALGREVTL